MAKETQTIKASEVGTVPAEVLETNSPLAKMAAQAGGTVLQKFSAGNQDDFDELAKGGWLPRLQLEGSSANIVKRNKIGKGHYAFHTGKDKFFDLGLSVDVLVLAYRAKALNIKDPKKILTSYDRKSKEFQAIQGLADSSNKETRQGCLYGIEFLLYIPSVPEAAEQKFCTLFMGSPTSRRAARDFKVYTDADTLEGRRCTLSHQVIDNGEYIWEGITVAPCSTPLKYPSDEEIMKQINDFRNPPKTSFELVESEGVEGDEGERG